MVPFVAYPGAPFTSGLVLFVDRAQILAKANVKIVFRSAAADSIQSSAKAEGNNVG